MREAWGRLQAATAGHLGDADARVMEREVEAASGSQKELAAFLDKANNFRLRNEVCALPVTSCRERILFNQLDAASGMWTVAIPTARTAMTPHELRKVAAGIAVRREVDDLFKQAAVPLGNTVPRDELKDVVPNAELSLPAFNVVTGSYDPRSLKSTPLEFKTMRRLVALTVPPTAVADDGLAALQQLQRLEYLSVARHGVHAFVDPLRDGHPGRKHQVTANGLAALWSLPALQQLDLGRACFFENGAAMALRGLSQLTSLSLAGMSQLDDLSLGVGLAGLTALRHLDLSGCWLLSGPGLRAGLCRMPALTSLNLDDMSLLGRDTLDEVMQLPLTSLSLAKCSSLSDEVMASLPPRLQSLSLEGCSQLTDAGVAALGRLASSMQRLDLSRVWQLTDDALPALGALTALESLNLSFCDQLTAGGLTHLTGASCLTALDLHGCSNIGDAGVMALAPLRRMASLAVGGCPGLNLAAAYKLTKAGCVATAALPSLTSLRLTYGWGISDPGLEALSGLSALTELDLTEDRNISDAGLAHLGALPLASLTLERCRYVSSAGLADLAPRLGASLRRLNLTGCPEIGAAGLAALAACSGLEVLALGGCGGVTDAAVTALPPSLRSLAVPNCKRLTDEGLASLGGRLCALVALELSGCEQVTDAGMSHLAGLAHLRMLGLEGCERVSAAHVLGLFSPDLIARM
eukprot:jgi/Tetstr1/462987/TSEL_007928.t1